MHFPHPEQGKVAGHHSTGKGGEGEDWSGVTHRVKVGLVNRLPRNRYNRSFQGMLPFGFAAYLAGGKRCRHEIRGPKKFTWGWGGFGFPQHHTSHAL